MGKTLQSKSVTIDQQRGGQHKGRPSLPLKASASLHLRQSALGAPSGALARGLVTARTRPSSYGGHSAGEEGDTPSFPVNSC